MKEQLFVGDGMLVRLEERPPPIVALRIDSTDAQLRPAVLANLKGGAYEASSLGIGSVGERVR